MLTATQEAAGTKLLKRKAWHPTPVTSVTETTGLHTGTFATIGGREFVFAAKNPENPALVVYDVTEALY